MSLQQQPCHASALSSAIERKRLALAAEAGPRTKRRNSDSEGFDDFDDFDERRPAPNLRDIMRADPQGYRRCFVVGVQVEATPPSVSNGDLLYTLTRRGVARMARFVAQCPNSGSSAVILDVLRFLAEQTVSSAAPSSSSQSVLRARVSLNRDCSLVEGGVYVLDIDIGIREGRCNNATLLARALCEFLNVGATPSDANKKLAHMLRRALKLDGCPTARQFFQDAITARPYTAGQEFDSPLASHQRSAVAFMRQEEARELPIEFMPLDISLGSRVWYSWSSGKITSNPEGSNYRGGFLYDATGMGKTRSVLQLVAEQQASKPDSDSINATLYLCSLNQIEPIRAEARELASPLRIVTALELLEHPELRQDGGFDVILLPYEQLSEDAVVQSVIAGRCYRRAIADDSHLLEQQSATTWLAVQQIESRMRWCVTSRPSAPQSIVNQIAFLRPDAAMAHETSLMLAAKTVLLSCSTRCDTVFQGLVKHAPAQLRMTERDAPVVEAVESLLAQKYAFGVRESSRAVHTAEIKAVESFFAGNTDAHQQLLDCLCPADTETAAAAAATTAPSSPPVEEALECAVCLEEHRSYNITPCGHKFCQSCLKGVLNVAKQSRCPLCRSEFSRVELKYHQSRADVSLPNVFHGKIRFLPVVCKALLAEVSKSLADEQPVLAVVAADGTVDKVAAQLAQGSPAEFPPTAMLVVRSSMSWHERQHLLDEFFASNSTAPMCKIVVGEAGVLDTHNMARANGILTTLPLPLNSLALHNTVNLSRKQRHLLIWDLQIKDSLEVLTDHSPSAKLRSIAKS